MVNQAFGRKKGRKDQEDADWDKMKTARAWISRWGQVAGIECRKKMGKIKISNCPSSSSLPHKLWWELSLIVHVKSLEEFLAYSKHSINLSNSSDDAAAGAAAAIVILITSNRSSSIDSGIVSFLHHCNNYSFGT